MSTCVQCSLACHKKCLETLAIQCGHKKLQGRLHLFGIDFTQVAKNSQDGIPFIIRKCTSEIENRALNIKVFSVKYERQNDFCEGLIALIIIKNIVRNYSHGDRCCRRSLPQISSPMKKLKITTAFKSFLLGLELQGVTIGTQKIA